MDYRSWALGLIAGLTFGLCGCRPGGQESVYSKDWDDIVKQDTLSVLMENSASTFYNYQGVSQGFDSPLPNVQRELSDLEESTFDIYMNRLFLEEKNRR